MELMQLLQRYHVPDDAVYALDHYLAKETVENLLTFRFGNALFRSIWSGEYIQEIQVTVAEETTVADRQNSYREIGVVRDMVQSHILQLIALVTMNEAAAWSPEAMATTKRERIASLRVDQKKVVLGQYRDAGVGTTPTYVATSLSIDDPSWKGVPILVRTGKALPQTVTDVTVRFKSGASSLLGSRLHGTQLTFRIQPDESIFMTMVVKQPGTTHELAHARMTFCYHDAFREVHPDTYVRVLDSVLCGKRTSCVDFATINALWDVVAALPIEGEPTIYEPGSWGPPEAAELVAHYKTDWTITTGDVCNGVTLMPYA
jgi:glucose-6-phosphate 1-dehydrogenase